MSCYALIFSFAENVKTARFEARVRGDGRALAELADGEWWCHGVEPGGLTDSGSTPAAAFANFRRTLGHVLEELADGSENFADFNKGVQAFFGEVDRAEEQRWNEALERIRRGVAVEEPMDSFKRVNADERRRIVVDRLSEYVGESDSVGLAAPSSMAA
jgi:hypothetical protein